jgi:hypothetical protein
MIRTTLTAISAALTLTLVLATSTACYRHTIVAGSGAPTRRLIYDHWENFWIIGLIGDTKLDVAQICPSGNTTIEARRTFLNGFVSALTSGIYTPTTLRVRCQDGRTAGILLEGDDVRRIVHDERFADWVGVDAPERLNAVVAAQAFASGQ